MTNPINVNIKLEQITDGEAYRGSFKLDDLNFNYQLRFEFHLRQLAEQEEKGLEGLMSQVHFDVTDSRGREVELDKYAKEVFFFMVGRLAMGFYEDLRTQAKSFKSMRSTDIAPADIVPLQASTTISYRIKRTEDYETILAHLRKQVSR